MSVLNNSNAISTGGAYNITDSLRFRGSQNLTRLPSTAGNTKTYTYSMWLKRGSIGTSPYVFDVSDGTNRSLLYFNASASEALNVFNHIGGTNYQVQTSASFRDTSAWYHIVVATDTTQATASDRVKIWINGEQVTSFSATGYPPQNSNTGMNTASIYSTMYIGSSNSSTQDFDGYITEYNHIDGQALDASYFGETNADGVWSPIEYTGTYGTNGFYLNFADKTDFKSFELDGTGDYISAPASEYSNYINGSGDFTIEWWVNYDALPSDGGWYAQDSGSAVVSPFNLFQQTNNWRLYATTANGAWNVFSNTLLATTSLTTNRWYHIACVRNGSTLTLYVDGVSQGSQSIGTASLWQDTSHNLSLFNDWQSAGGGGGIDGTISNYRLVKGTAVYTSNFTPPTANLENISGTTILLARSTSTADLSGNITTTANGNLSLVDHLPPISSAIGDDVSGNDNHFATNNFDLTSTATTYDLMSDTPSLADEDTSNFCTLNAVLPNPNSGTFSEANLAWAGASHSGTRGTFGMTSGKWYWEVTNSSGSNNSIGISQDQEALGFLGGGAYGWGYYNSGLLYTSGSGSSYGASFTTNDVIGVAFDADAGSLVFYKNGVSQGTAVTGLTSAPYYPAISSYYGSLKLNFGQRPFAYTPPTGFKKLNTFNLPDSSITDGSQYFDATLYTGNGSTQTITNAGGFSPDLVWLKNRSIAQIHGLFDSVRGAGKLLSSDQTSAETSGAAGVSSFNSDGFGLGNVFNNNTNAFVAWQWRGSDSTAVSNTDGTITSTVSANTTAGFSVVTYTGNATAGATIGHGLGVAPNVVILKNRDSSAHPWVVYHSSNTSAPETDYLLLNTSAATVDSGLIWNDTAPTSSVFTVGSATTPNGNGNKMIGYCFAEVEGFSKFGSYTGNGSADGPFVYTGFRPAFVIIKRSNSTGNWIMLDTSRDIDNDLGQIVYSDLSSAEGTGSSGIYRWDFLSNGFKVRGTGNSTNASGSTYTYMAFAENPFKNSLAR